MLYAFWENEPWSTPIAFMDELKRRGHELTRWNLYHNDGRITKEGEIRKYSNHGINCLLQELRTEEFNPDVIFHLDYGVFDAAQLDKAHYPDAVWIMESGDDPQAFRMNALKAHKFDFVVTPDKQCAGLYRNHNINAHWQTHCADSYVFKPLWDTDDKRCDAGVVTTCGERGYSDFIGVTHEMREQLGSRFLNDRFFWGDDHARFLNRGKIIFQCSQHLEVTRRIFEGAACGRMVLTDRLPEDTAISEIFTDGVDIVYYNNTQDAVDKARYYLEHDEEREAIATAGFRTVSQGHTVIHRVDFLEKMIREVQCDKQCTS